MSKSYELQEHKYDVIVVGSGNGGLTAALCCYEMGCKDVLVVEKSDLYGGTSSISGGGVWIPGNRYAMAAGAEDSAAKAKTYLRQLISEEEVPEQVDGIGDVDLRITVRVRRNVTMAFSALPAANS